MFRVYDNILNPLHDHLDYWQCSLLLFASCLKSKYSNCSLVCLFCGISSRFTELTIESTLTVSRDYTAPSRRI